jgi:hypothetical protein
MCMCDHKTCPKCDPGIEAFYQRKVKEARDATAALKTQGIEMDCEDLLDAKDIWYEYCALRDAEKADDAIQPNNEDECTY